MADGLAQIGLAKVGFFLDGYGRLWKSNLGQFIFGQSVSVLCCVVVGVNVGVVVCCVCWCW